MRSVATKQGVSPEESTRYGIGRCKPRCIQPCANIKMFTFVLSAFVFVTITMWVYRVGMLSTLEKRFRLSTSESSFTFSSFEIGHICTVVFTSYIGANTNKPRVIAFGGILCALSGLLFALPHVLYGSGRGPSSATYLGVPNSTAHAQLCTDANVTADESSCDENVEIDIDRSNNAAYIMLVLSAGLLGSALSPMVTLGMTYIYDNVDKDQAPIYFGKYNNLL